MPDRTFKTIGQALDEHLLWNASLLQYRGRSCVARQIKRFGRGEHSHSAMLCHLYAFKRQLMVAEVREWYGGRIVTLESQVAAYSGLIDVYRPDPHDEFKDWKGNSPGKAVDRMLRFAGSDYGWSSVLRAGLYHLPGIRTRLKPPTDDSAEWDLRPPYCSHAGSMSYRAAGVDPVPNLADEFTAPNDLSRSKFFEYACTLVAA